MKNDIDEERIIRCVINCKLEPFILVQVYAPTGDCSEKESVETYQKIEDQINSLQGISDKSVVIIGDFNASIGECAKDKIVGRSGLGEKNDEGQLPDFCSEHFFTTKSTSGIRAKKEDMHGWELIES